MTKEEIHSWLLLLPALFSVVLLAGSVQALGWNQSAYNITYLLNEDTPYYHNFTVNVTDPISSMVFSVNTLGGTPIKWNGVTISYPDISYWINFTNATLGVFLLNATADNQTGNFSIPIEVAEAGAGTGATATFFFNITAVNDAPRFQTLENQSFNRSTQFEYLVNITDEEDNMPFTLNITFLNCSVAAWSTRNCTAGGENLTLFNSSQYSFNGTQLNISFTPTRNDVGNYTINFTITDSGNTTQPHNASRSEIINFEVLNINEIPQFTWVCDSDQNVSATEDTEFSCYINATDIDELNNLTFTANYSWFNFSETNSSSVQIVGQYNFSTLVKINATDAIVGDWTVNLSATDTSSPAGINSTLLNISIANKNDSVYLSDIPNQTGYTSDNKIVQINATDDDLLIPDKSKYNEVLTFTTNNSYVTVASTDYVSGTSRTNATLLIDTASLGPGNHTINVTVRDANNYSVSSDLFTINIAGNSAPEWNSTLQTTYVLIEDTAFYLNLSANVSDADGDSLTYSATINNNEFTFSGFSIGAATGVIDFTPTDIDVGYHDMKIAVSDTKTTSYLDFNFTVYNINDTPVIITDPTATQNITYDAGFLNVVVAENNYTSFQLLLQDEDYKVIQPSFYDEDLSISVTIEGPNETLISFSDPPSTPDLGNQTHTNAAFTPKKTDVGTYNITINVTDNSGLSVTHSFNLTVLEVSNPPTLTDIDNQIFSVLNETFYFDANATDLESGNDTFSPGNFTFVLTNLTTGGDFLTINSTTGVINFTFNQTHAGLWEYSLVVNDTDGETDTDYFNVTVYDYPYVILPLESYQFNMKENVTSQLNFTVNHTVQDELNYTLSISGAVRNSTLGYGNATPFYWNLTPGFDDETTCTDTITLTLNVSNSKLSNSTSWNLTVNHTNYPLSFSSTIPSQSGGSPLSLTLSDFFTDPDASDSCINQTIGFIYTMVENSTSGNTISATITNWTNMTTPLAEFTAESSTSNAVANFSITAYEYNTTESSTIISTVSSNNFTVTILPSEATTPQQSSGGGGSTTRIISLKLLVPEPVSAKQKDRLVIPLGLVNDGDVDLRGIDLSAAIAKSGLLRNDLIASFDRSSFGLIRRGDRENVTMIVDIDTSTTGLFEVTINATVASPKYSDWAKFFIEIREEEDVLERIVFTEEFIIGNPECAEFLDLIEESKSIFAKGFTDEALRMAESSLDACKRAISQPPRPRIYERIGDKFFSYAAIASLVAFALGFAYYYYEKHKLKKRMEGY